MMSLKSVRSMLALSLLAAAPLAAQTGTPREAAPGRMEGRMAQPGAEGRAFGMLIARRRDLNLSDAQVARLQEIGRRLEERNRPLRERLTAERQSFTSQRRAELERLTPEQRRDTLRQLRQGRRQRQLPEAMRAPMEQMRANIRQATTEAQGVLTEDQKRRARELMKEARATRRQQGRGRPGARGNRAAPPAPAARP